LVAALTVLTTFHARAASVLTVPGPETPTISAALARAGDGDTVIVEDGVYKESVLLGPGIVLKAASLFKAIVDGGGKGVGVTLANNSAVMGLEIRNSTIGVFSSGVGNTVATCRIVSNTQSGIMCVGHLPAIHDNIIAYNKGSGIQGWDVRSTKSSINHNTIAYNGNHGISVGGNSNIIVENSIIAFNEQFGVKLEPEASRANLVGNDFYGNTSFSRTLPTNNIAKDPLFVDPQRMDFGLKKKSPCIGRGADRRDLGARLPELE
jgi:nitrous oxidase accessory protein NosD